MVVTGRPMTPRLKEISVEMVEAFRLLQLQAEGDLGRDGEEHDQGL